MPAPGACDQGPAAHRQPGEVGVAQPERGHRHAGPSGNENSAIDAGFMADAVAGRGRQPVPAVAHGRPGR